MKKFFQHFFVLPFLWMAVPCWPVWASDNCSENAKALLAAEKNLGKLFVGNHPSLMVKRKLYFFEIETYQLEHSFFTLKGRQLDFTAKPPEYYGEIEITEIANRNDENILDFEHNSDLHKSKLANVSAQGTPIGTIKWKPISYGNRNLTGKMFELYSSQDGRMIGKIHVPHRDSQIFPLFDSRANRVGKIFNNKVSRENNFSLTEVPKSWKSAECGETFFIHFPKNWKNSENALFLAAALIIDTNCFYIR